MQEKLVGTDDPVLAMLLFVVPYSILILILLISLLRYGGEKDKPFKKTSPPKKQPMAGKGKDRAA